MKIHYAEQNLCLRQSITDRAEAYLKNKEKVVFMGNAILYSSRVPLAGGHSDDISLLEDPAQGWGWLAQKGFDIIQTDWTMHCVNYLRENNYRK